MQRDENGALAWRGPGTSSRLHLPAKLAERLHVLASRATLGSFRCCAGGLGGWRKGANAIPRAVGTSFKKRHLIVPCHASGVAAAVCRAVRARWTPSWQLPEQRKMQRLVARDADGPCSALSIVRVHRGANRGELWELDRRVWDVQLWRLRQPALTACSTYATTARDLCCCDLLALQPHGQRCSPPCQLCRAQPLGGKGNGGHRAAGPEVQAGAPGRERSA